MVILAYLPRNELDQIRELYKSPIQIWLDDNDILMYQPHNEGK